MEIKIKNLVRNAADGLVTMVMWEATKTVGEHTATISRNTQLERGNAFTSFEDLTEATVKEWVSAALTERETAVLEQALDNQIARKANPPVRPISGVPWSTCTPAI